MNNPPHQARSISISCLMRGIISYYSLFHADRHTGLESEFQVVIVHSYFFKQFLYKTSVKHANPALLPFYKFQQFTDAPLAFGCKPPHSHNKKGLQLQKCITQAATALSYSPFIITCF